MAVSLSYIASSPTSIEEALICLGRLIPHGHATLTALRE